MKKIVLILILSFSILLSCQGALFDKPDPGTDPTYTIPDLQQMFIWLEDYYGECSVIFVAEGGEMLLCKVTKSFCQATETAAVAKVLANPSIGAAAWADELYADYLTYFPESKWASMFNTLTQPQFNWLLNRVIWWNPDHDNTETRTFIEFRDAMQP